MSSRLVPSVRAAVPILITSVTVLTVLALLVHDRADNRVDRAIARRVDDLVSPSTIAHLLHLTDPPLIVAALALAALVAAIIRRWDVVVLVVTVPAISVLLTEKVLKPLVHRTDGVALAFPSGHETGVTSLACVVGVVLLASGVRVALKVLGVLVLLADVVLAAVGLVGSAFHYPTDTVGSLLLSLSVVLTVALAIDAASRPGRRARERLEPPAPMRAEPVA